MRNTMTYNFMEFQPDTVINNKYNVIKLLGKGAMGHVYLVKRISDSKEVVLKELMFSSDNIGKDEARELFCREAEIMKNFEHPCLPKMYEVFTWNGYDFIAMEYVKGDTLEELIDDTDKPFSENRAIGWIMDIAEGLDYLHNSFKNPIVYRDIKPSNIIITAQNKARLIDFGIARYYNPDKDTDTLRLGSPGYAAPEQYRGRGQSSPQSDIFGLGVVLYQLLTKYDPTVTPFKLPPMKSQNPLVSDELEKIVMKAMDVKPLKRYISAMELKEVLEKYLIEQNRKKSPKSHFTVQSQPSVQSQPIPVLGKKQSSGHQLKSPVTPARRFTLIETMIIVAIICILFSILIPNFMKARQAGIAEQCESSLKVIATALEMYYTDNQYYPPDLSYLTVNKNISYLKHLPICFASRDLPYKYEVNSKHNNYTLSCGGAGVHTMAYPNSLGNFPQYTPGKGIIWFH